MDLTLSPETRTKLKDFLICFSLGNLFFLRRWYDLEHLKERAMDYYRVQPSDTTLMAATLISAFLLAAAFWLPWVWVTRHPTPARMQLARCVFLLLLIFPLESVRRYWNSESTHPDLVSNASIFAIEALLGIGLVLTLRGNLRVVRAARRMALVLTLLFPSLVIDFAWGRLAEEPASAYQSKPPLPMLPPRPQVGGAAPHRVVWILFDELDQRLAFDLREPKVDFPELDRLRSESLVAGHASQTAGWTTLALPSLLSGQMYSRAELVDANTLRVYPEGAGKGVNWRDQPNVFKKARELGANAEIIGWHHPYCRVIGDAVARCLDVPNGHPTSALLREMSAAEEGVPRTIELLFKLQLGNLGDMLRGRNDETSENNRDTYVQARQLRHYFQIRDPAYCAVADKDIDLLFIHFPLPHPFAIYDRLRRDFTLSATTSYADNLALVDRTVGEIRSALESAGLWDSTSLLITSDHGLRPDMWRGQMGWTPELERLTAGGQSPTVPFIVKLAGETHGAVYDHPFSAVITSELVLAMLSGEVSTPGNAAAWLDSRQGTN